MKNYLVNAEKKTPEIIFITTGEFMITGNSRPEDAKHFYKPVFEWVEEFKKTNPERISLALDLDYINSVSIRLILNLLETLRDCVSDKNEFKIIWKYDSNDLDMLDQGKILEKTLGHPFEFFEKPA
jgi:hypothetical protein